MEERNECMGALLRTGNFSEDRTVIEKQIERKLKDQVEACIKGAMCLKFESPGFTGVPDRILLLPNGVIAFVETKAPGKKERARQELVQSRIRSLGFQVFSHVDSEERIAEVLRWCRAQ